MTSRPQSTDRSVPSWDDAWQAAADLGRARIPRTLPVGLDRAAGRVLAVEVRASAHLPAADVAAVDGWAVSGRGPWRQASADALRLEPGQASRVATGGALPRPTDAVIPSEDVTLDLGQVHAGQPPAGADIRRRGEELVAGEVLLPRGTVLTPARLGLAASAGADAVHVVVEPRAVLLVTGDELVDTGAGRPGRVRDSLSHVVPGLLHALGAQLERVARAADDRATLRDVFAGPFRSTVDLVVTTGGAGHGETDHVRRALADVGATLVVDGMNARPGGPVMLAAVPDGPVVLALPGNPLAAVAGLLSLGGPWLAGWLGVPDAGLQQVSAPEATPHPLRTLLVPSRLDLRRGTAVPQGHVGPAMLRGLADADGFAVLTPGRAARWLPLPV